MNTNISPQYMYQTLTTLPKESLTEIWQFIEFVKYKKQNALKAPHSIKLGGLLSGYDVDITEEDIRQARQEMWNHLGELNE